MTAAPSSPVSGHEAEADIGLRFRATITNDLRSGPWLYRELYKAPDWVLVDVQTGLEYWPSPRDVERELARDREQALLGRVRELEALTGPPAGVSAKLAAAQRMIAEVAQEIGPLDEQLRRVKEALGGDRA